MSYDPTKPIEIHAEAPTPQISKPPTGSSADRIAAAREEQIKYSKDHDRAHSFNRHAEWHYRDFSGEQTSVWDFEHTICLLYKLEHPQFIGLWCNRDMGTYNHRMAVWTEDTPKLPGIGHAVHSLADLKSALDTRIQELGLSRALIEEWFATIHNAEESQNWNRMSFEERMNTFKVQP